MKSSLLFFAPKGDTDLLLRKPNFRSHQELSGAPDPDAAAEEDNEVAEQDDQTEPQHAVEEFEDVPSSIESFDDLK
ncbi:hypothetical protein FNYG_01226 [Fusarium nygamai]|uniref:Uncharacterized protein n=1 Tax=Gibberella nygamai TaxID=42673 RepID=A0A2K0WSY2_GIBNY|nr:hypothetical protein FNYG_01226 [Fusarium nygamai]